MGIRSHIAAVLFGSSAGGLALSLGLVLFNQSLETAAQDLGARSLVLGETEEFRRRLDDWLVEAEAGARAGGAAAEGARESGATLLPLLDALADESSTELEQRPLAELRSGIGTIREGLGLALEQDEEGPVAIARREELAEGVSTLKEGLLTAIDTYQHTLSDGLDDLRLGLREDRQELWQMAWVSGVGYLGLLIALWLWTTRRLIVPLQALTRSSQWSLAEGRPLDLPPDGPLEVQQLTRSLATLVESLLGAREHLEEKVRERTAELERAGRAKSEFLANVSHEIRTPMTAILGYAELCRDPGLSDAERLAHLETIGLNGEHLMAVIGDILDISRIEAGKLVVRQEESSPRAILQEVWSLMEASAREKGLEFTCEGAEEGPGTIVTDPTRLRQILINLVGNAIKFTEEGRVTLRLVPVDEEVAFEVEDTGMGMDAQSLEQIFQPFVQADTSATRIHGGTGLGLSISRALARLLGGTLSCESEPGIGSIFRVALPAEVALEAPDADQAETGGACPPARFEGRVLLAEDVPVNRKLVATLLERAGLVVDQVGNGREALDAALDALGREEPYDLVLMDMQMPEMDGYEATRRLREATYAAPVVALTAHSMAGERERCLEVGCDEYTTKPIDKETLLGVLATFLAPEDSGTESLENAPS